MFSSLFPGDIFNRPCVREPFIFSTPGPAPTHNLSFATSLPPHFLQPGAVGARKRPHITTHLQHPPSVSLSLTSILLIGPPLFDVPLPVE
jgi:hypothetical protein